MKHNRQKWLALLLSLTMTLSLFPTTALATDDGVDETDVVVEETVTEEPATDDEEDVSASDGEDVSASDDGADVPASDDEGEDVSASDDETEDVVVAPTLLQSNSIDITSEEDALVTMSEEVPTSTVDNSDITFNTETQTITAYPDSGEKDLVIPASINGVTVLKIADGVFSGRNLTSLSFEEGSQLQTIGKNAFYGNTSMTFTGDFPSTLTSIGEYGFFNCSSITGSSTTGITLPDGIDTVAQYTFYGCSKLTSVTMSDAVTSIGQYAFYGCSSLTSITLPEGITTVAQYTFYGCSSLAAIHIPAGITTIGTYAYYGCTSAKTITFATDSELTSIGSYGFYDCDDVTTISLPENLETIGISAFSWCNALKSVTLSDGLTSIPSYAFQYCYALDTIHWPTDSKITSIGTSAFYSCTSLVTVTLPDSVTFVGTSAFYNCTVLETLNWSANCTTIYSVLGNSSVYPKVVTVNVPFAETEATNPTYFGYTAAVYWTDTVKIDDFLYSPTRQQITKYVGEATEVSIPSTLTDADDTLYTVTGLATGAFCNNDTITKVTFAGDLTTSSYTFYSCNYLATVENLPTVVNAYDFYYTSALSDIDLSHVTSIGTYAFAYYAGITKANLSSVTSIGSSAFYYYTKLTEVTFGDYSTLTSLPSSCFSYCSSLSSVTLPTSLTTINSSCFYYCTSLTSITIPNTIQTISSSAFSSCSKLATIMLAVDEDSVSYSPWGATNATVLWGDTLEIGDYYYSITNQNIVKYIGTATVVSIPETLTLNDVDYPVTSIAGYAFSNNDTITSVTIPASFTAIGDYAFYDCDALVSIDLGTNSNITSIGSYAFYDCTELDDVTLPDFLTTIGNYAFNNCDGFTSIAIPSSVTSIGSRAFYSCSYLTDVSFASSGLKTIGSEAFYYCTQLAGDLVLPSSLTSLGYSAFRKTAITSVDIQGTLTTIGTYAFMDCASLETVTMSDTITSISTSAFYGCTALTDITLSEKLTSIGATAFSGCTSLKSIIIPSTISTLTTTAFSGTDDMMIIVDQTRDTQTFHSSAPWGSGSGTSTYFKGEIIDFTVVVTDVDGSNQKQVVVTATIGGSLSINTITVPDGVTVVVEPTGSGTQQWTATYTVDANGSYTFTGTTSNGVSSSETVKITDIGIPTITSDASANFDAVGSITAADIITALDASAVDPSGATVDITISDSDLAKVNALTLTNSSTKINLIAENSAYGQTVTQEVTIFMTTEATVTIVDVDGATVFTKTLDVGTVITYENPESTTLTTVTAAGGTFSLPTPYTNAGYTFSAWAYNTTTNVISTTWTLNAPVVNAISDVSKSYDGQSVTLTASASHDTSVTYGYLWSTGDTTQSITLTDVADSGTYSVTVTATDGDNKTATATQSATVTISAASVTAPTADATSYTYTGSEQAYVLTESTLYTISGTTATSAGTHTVTVSLNDTANYQWSDATTADVTYDFVIGKASVTAPTADATSYTYTGSEQTYTLESSTLYTISGTTATSAGTHTVTVSLNDTANYQWSDGSTADVTYDFVIGKASVTAPTADGTVFTYTGSEQTYTLETSTLYSISGTTATSAGTHTVTVSLNDTANYQWSDATTADLSYSFVIGADGLAKPTADATAFTYNGAAQTYTLVTNALYTISNNTTQTDAGTYTITVSLDDKANYTWADGSTDDVTYSFVIAPLAVDFSWDYTDAFTYDGTNQSVTATLDNLCQGDSVTFTYGDATNNVETAAGTYTAQVTALSNSNYTLTNGTDTALPWVIQSKSITGAWSGTSATYTGSVQTPTMTSFTGVVDGDSVIATCSGGTTAGTYTSTASLDNGNYTLANPNTTFTISKAPITFTVDAAGDVSASDGFTQYTVSYVSSTGATTSEKPTASGTYSVVVTIAEAYAPNYRINGTALTSGTVGQLVIGATIKTYTVTFGNDVTYTDVPSGSVLVIPAGSDDGYNVFASWSYNNKTYKAGETFTVTSDATFEAMYQAVFTITGIVNDANNNPLDGAVVTLMSGSNQIDQETTNTDGAYTFINVLPGTYNIVVTYDGVTKTSITTISDTNVTIDTITMPKGQTNSIVEVVDGTPDIVVGGLDTEFTVQDVEDSTAGTSIELKMTVVETDTTVSEIEEVASNVGIYLDIDITKTVADISGSTTTPVTETSQLLTIIIPIPGDLQGKASYTIYRMHTNALGEAELHTITTQVNDYGEYLTLNEDKTELTLCVKYFSTYALAFTEYSNSSGTSSYTSTLASTTNGSASLSGTKNAMNSTVTVTTAPDDGYTVGAVTVTYESGRTVSVTDNGDGTYRYLQPGANVTVTVTFTSMEDTLFSDVSPDDWFYDAVDWAVTNGIASGYADGTFKPYGTTTRAQAVSFLWRAMGEPEATGVNPFTDVSEDAYYYQAVLWAVENGITVGTTDTTFSPNKDCSRAHIITFLWRLDGEKVVNSINLFTDVQTSNYYYNAVLWAVGSQITTGTTDTAFSPNADCNRAQILTFLYRHLAD